MPLKTPLRVETKGLWAGIYDADGVLICGNDFATTDTAEDDVKNYAEIVAAVNGHKAAMKACQLLIAWRDHPISGAMSAHAGLLRDAVSSAIAALAASTPTQGGEG